MNDPVLTAIRDVVQVDVGNRGLFTDPLENLITACPHDFESACHSLVAKARGVAVVTGFFIPHAHPPCGETDGPLGALFLARALVPLGIRVALVTDAFCVPALNAGLAACGLDKDVELFTLPPPPGQTDWPRGFFGSFPLTHLVALERVGPSHTPESLRLQPGTTPEVREQFLREVAAEHQNRCHTMRGRDITNEMSPAHQLFEAASAYPAGITTIGVGDGGNEIGMGRIPWPVIRRNITGGGPIACRVTTDFLIVCGVSNWGAYALAAGIGWLRGAVDHGLFDVHRERQLLQIMVEQGPLVDGLTGEASPTVDGLPFERYAEPLRRLDEILQRSAHQNTNEEARMDLSSASGGQVREQARLGAWTSPTPGLALGYVQANLVVVPRELAFDFLLFCQRNPKPCPLLDVTEPGDAEPRYVAPGADLRTDVPRYRVYQHGEVVDEPTDLGKWWRPDLVGFLLGCSFTFESALLQAGLPLRHLEMGCNVPMYRTNIACRPAGMFQGPMVVSMRPMTPSQAITATRVCARFPRAHGTPVHFGDPAAIGVRSVSRPDFGDAVEIRPGEVTVFWACGVTPQAVAMQARPPLLITHKPGHMFVTDLRDIDLEGG